MNPAEPGEEEESSLKEEIAERLGTLLAVKSLVTLMLTGVFAWMAVRGQISRDFMTIYVVIIAFYFGTQNGRRADGAEGGKRGKQV